jgi:DNA-binding transcriptional MerR regulator
MEKVNKYFTKGEAIRFLEIAHQTLINWEKLGRIKAIRDKKTNFRLYAKEDVVRLKNEIKKSQNNAYKIDYEVKKEIKDMLKVCLIEENGERSDFLKPSNRPGRDTYYKQIKEIDDEHIKYVESGQAKKDILASKKIKNEKKAHALAVNAITELFVYDDIKRYRMKAREYRGKYGSSAGGESV